MSQLLTGVTHELSKKGKLDKLPRNRRALLHLFSAAHKSLAAADLHKFLDQRPVISARAVRECGGNAGPPAFSRNSTIGDNSHFEML